ncbi:MAG TPA: type II toxin-antitoxin system RelE/ParE family toxin [Gammaproteobacteria bacterium]|nr:type II toxin-antitoxin system RelE/ParE family toxin [Gammaproteobacteria bacterium]
MTYYLSPSAEKDIEEVASYYLSQNLSVALNFIDSVYEAMEMLAANPMLGHKRADLTDRSIRVWPFKWHYLIFYTDEIPIKVVRVLSGYRDISSLLGNVGSRFIEPV